MKQYNNSEGMKGQEISFKNYNPFILSLNKLLDDLFIIGNEMYNNPIKMGEYYIALQNIYSRYSKYFFKKEKIDKNLSDIDSFINSSNFTSEVRKWNTTNGVYKFTEPMRKNIVLCRKKLLDTFQKMNDQFAENGLIPIPEKKREEIWEKHQEKWLRNLQKGALEVIFGDLEQ